MKMRNSSPRLLFFLLAVSAALVHWTAAQAADNNNNGGGGLNRHRRRHSVSAGAAASAQGNYNEDNTQGVSGGGAGPQSDERLPAPPSWLAPEELARVVAEPLNKRGLSLACRAGGNPRPDILWTKDGLNVETERHSADPFGLLRVGQF